LLSLILSFILLPLLVLIEPSITIHCLVVVAVHCFSVSCGVLFGGCGHLVVVVVVCYGGDEIKSKNQI
jgi:hypothetical protein